MYVREGTMYMRGVQHHKILDKKITAAMGMKKSRDRRMWVVARPGDSHMRAELDTK